MVDKSLGMSLRRFALCGVVSIVLLLITATPSLALNPVPGGEVVTTYLEGYELADVHRTHRGIDIAGTPGQTVVAPVDGTVSFSGTIPATETESGTTMLGVSLRLSDGRTVTLMPFETIWAQEGQAVAEGQALGTLAPSGDASNAAPHLHLGIKEGRAYQDPTWLLGMLADTHAEDEYQPEALPLAAADTGAVAGSEASADTGLAFSSALPATAGAGESLLPEGGIQTEEVTITGTVTSGAVDPSELESNANVSTDDASSEGFGAQIGAAAKIQLQRIAAFLSDLGKGALAGGLSLAAACVAAVMAAAIVHRRKHAGLQKERPHQENTQSLRARFLRASRGRSWQH